MRLPALITSPSLPQATLFVQLMQSGTAMLVSFALLGLLDVREFGAFALAQACALFVVGLIDAGLLVPATVRYTRLGPERASRRLRSLLPTTWGLCLVLSLATVAVLGLAYEAFGLPATHLLATLAGVLLLALAWSAREMARQTLAVQRRPQALLLQELISSLLVLGLLLAWMLVGPREGPMLAMALLLLALSGLLPALLLLGGGPRVQRHWLGAALWRRGRQSAQASLLSWIQSQSYLYWVAALLSAAAVGQLATVRLVFQPLQTVFSGLSRGWLTELSAHGGEAQRRLQSRRLMLRGLLAVVLSSALWFALALLLRPVLQDWLAERGYRFELLLFVGWALTFALTCGRGLLTQVQRAQQAYAALARQSAAGAVLALLLVPLAIHLAGAPGALAGLIIVELVVLGLQMRQIVAAQRKD